MLGALIHCWVHLVGVSGGEKAYSGSSIIIIIYPTFLWPLGGGTGWMAAGDIGCRTLIIDHVINHGSLGASSLLGSFGGGFEWGKMYLGTITLVIA